MKLLQFLLNICTESTTKLLRKIFGVQAYSSLLTILILKFRFFPGLLFHWYFDLNPVLFINILGKFRSICTLWKPGDSPEWRKLSVLVVGWNISENAILSVMLFVPWILCIAHDFPPELDQLKAQILYKLELSFLFGMLAHKLEQKENL